MVLQKIFEGFLTKCGYVGHLGNVTSIMSLNFNFIVQKTYIQNLVQNGQLVSEKINVIIFICK